jgi:invasion protein IalB
METAAMRRLQISHTLAVILFGIASASASGPQRTTAVFADWTVVCNFPTNKPKDCEILGIQTLPGQNVPFGQIGVAHPEKAGDYKITVLTPPNVWLQTGTKLFPEDKGSIVASFKWCSNTRCLAEAVLSKAALKKMASRTQPARAGWG